MKSTYYLAALLLVCLSCRPNPNKFCDFENPLPKADRLLGIDFRSDDNVASLENNASFANALGINFTAIDLNWSDLEIRSGIYVDKDNRLATLQSSLSTLQLKLSLTINTIGKAGKTLPNDRLNSSFRDSATIQQFLGVLDFVFSIVDYRDLSNLQIGKEVDTYNIASEGPGFWDDYAFFLAAVNAHVDTMYPGLKVGFTGSFSGLVAAPDTFQRLADAVDILGVTYYPLLSDYRANLSDAAYNDLAALLLGYDSTTVYLQEVGYVAGKNNNSSNSKQAEFYCHFFKAWDLHRDRIKAVHFVRLYEMSNSAAAALATQYNISNSNYLGFQTSLGLIDINGQIRPAYEVLKEHANLRGW